MSIVPIGVFERIIDAKYPGFKFRTNQKEAILGILHTIANSHQKYIVLSAPTGVGKSWIGRMVAEVYNTMLETETLFLTKTIALQNQYLEDFPEIAKLMSADNYDCAVDYPVPIPPHMKAHANCRYTATSGMCEYKKARDTYNHSKLKTLNYAFFLHGIDKYNTKGLLVVDEAHNLESSILDTFSITLSFSKLREEGLGDAHLDEFLPDSEAVKKLTMFEIKATLEFLREIIVRISDSIEAILEMLSTEVNTQALLKLLETRLKPLENKKNRLSKLGKILSLIAGDDINRWDIEYDKEEQEFSIKPVFIPVHLHNVIFGPANKILFMSATTERVTQSLKLPASDCLTLTLPYSFNLANRPFYAITSLPSLNRNTFSSAFPKYVGMVDDIIDQYPPETNMIIHTVSYSNANKLKEMSRHSNRIFIPTSEQVRTLKEYTGGGTIVASPSISEGVDLGNGLAAVQIFIKVPWGFLGDSWVTKKMEYDEGWYNYEALLGIIQGSGRGVRSESDKADSFMLDPSFKRLLNNTDHYVPKWFNQCISWI